MAVLIWTKVLWCCLNSHYYVIFGAVQERIHTCTSHFKSASVVRDQEVLSEPYDDDEMGLGVWHPYCIYFDRGLIEWLSYYIYNLWDWQSWEKGPLRTPSGRSRRPTPESNARVRWKLLIAQLDNRCNSLCIDCLYPLISVTHNKDILYSNVL